MKPRARLGKGELITCSSVKEEPRVAMTPAIMKTKNDVLCIRVLSVRMIVPPQGRPLRFYIKTARPHEVAGLPVIPLGGAYIGFYVCAINVRARVRPDA